jgi:hypothetical protein
MDKLLKDIIVYSLRVCGKENEYHRWVAVFERERRIHRWEVLLNIGTPVWYIKAQVINRVLR